VNAQARPPGVLITRPAGQAELFKKQCELAGFNTTTLPCVQIQFLEAKLVLSELQQASQVVFTSTNAVHGAQQLLPFPWTQVSVCALGPATERALNDLGQPLNRKATTPYNSEALLSGLQVDGMPPDLTIIKGVGGRSWLSAANIDVICVTSDEILRNLMSLAGERFASGLLNLPLICNSERCANLARSLGFKFPAMVASAPGDSGQLARLKEWQKREWPSRGASDY